jgi:anti-sigma regulatory factor (Ser/Thr protein kinase)
MGPHALAELIPAWPRQTHLELGAFPSAVPCARAHVRAVATECGLAHLADAAELLASEIVTNAVQASDQLKIAETPVVRITVTTERESLLIRVWDGSDRMPVHQQAGPNDDGGRGLTIIEALSTDWGACLEADGKVVWALIGPIPSGGFGCNSRAPASSSSSS